MSLRTSTPRLGTDGERKLIPHSGDTPASVEGVLASRGSDGPRRTLIAYSLGLGVLAVAVGLALLAFGATLGNPWVVVALCAAAVLTDRASVRLSETTDLTAISSGDALRGGPVRAACGRSRWCRVEFGDAELLRRSGTNRAPALRWLTYTSTRFISGAAMGLTAQAILDRADSNYRIVLGHNRRFRGRRGSRSCVRGTYRIGQEQPDRGDPNRRTMMATAVCRLRPRRCEPRVCVRRGFTVVCVAVLGATLASQQLFSLYQEKATALGAGRAIRGVESRQPKASEREPLLCDGACARRSRKVTVTPRVIPEPSPPTARDIASALGLPLEETGAHVCRRPRPRHREDRSSPPACSIRRDASLSTSAARWNAFGNRRTNSVKGRSVR